MIFERYRLCQLVLLAGLGLAVGACADCSRDPSQVGLGCATANLASGVYAEDEVKTRREIEALEARRELLQAEADRLAADARRLTGDRQRLARRVSDLNAEAAAMNRRVAELSDEETLDRARLAELRERQRRLSDSLLTVSRDENPDLATLRDLEAERDRLLVEIADLAAAA